MRYRAMFEDVHDESGEPLSKVATLRAQKVFGQWLKRSVWRQLFPGVRIADRTLINVLASTGLRRQADERWKFVKDNESAELLVDGTELVIHLRARVLGKGVEILPMANFMLLRSNPDVMGQPLHQALVASCLALTIGTGLQKQELFDEPLVRLPRAAWYDGEPKWMTKAEYREWMALVRKSMLDIDAE